MALTNLNTTRRSTRVRVEIPIAVTSLDRLRPFAEPCVAIIVSAQGCAFRSSKDIQVGTPLLLSDLPRGGSVTARVANSLPLGGDGKYFLVGVSLYTHGNVWGIVDAPADWNSTAQAAADNSSAKGGALAGTQPAAGKGNWPYNRFSDGGEIHPGRK